MCVWVCVCVCIVVGEQKVKGGDKFWPTFWAAKKNIGFSSFKKTVSCILSDSFTLKSLIFNWIWKVAQYDKEEKSKLNYT